eukprot:SAG31_NODE_519_length_14648_cov_24.224895_3_plen_120_part_00
MDNPNVRQLMEMGLAPSPEVAARALEMSGQDIDGAVNLILSGVDLTTAPESGGREVWHARLNLVCASMHGLICGFSAWPAFTPSCTFPSASPRLRSAPSVLSTKLPSMRCAQPPDLGDH